MQLELFINFDGNCREAVDFYAKVFKSTVNNLMTYGQAPPNPNYAVSEADKDRIMYAGVPIGSVVVMFSDVPSGSEFVKGNNISPTVSTDNKDEVARIFNKLKEGGEVYMKLQTTFFSELFGMVKDQFGIIWQILYYSHKE
ncbi:MAG: VOC family protein [Paludibacter sp.]|nr:VOC family protein [Paludibacter sp.]